MGQDEQSRASGRVRERDAESQREQRQDVLRSLTGQLPAPPPPPPPASSLWESLRARREEVRQRRILLTVIVLAALGLAYIGGLTLRDQLATRQTTATSTPTPGGQAALVIAPFARNIHCPQAEAWSPGGTEIAVLGYEHGCPPNGFIQGTGSNSGVIGIYDASSGQPITTLPLDATVRPQVHGERSTIHYTGLTYVPGGRILVASFVIRDPLNRGNLNAGYGIFYSDVRGINTAATVYNVSDPSAAGYFNVFSGSAGVPSENAPLAPSLEYQWGGYQSGSSNAVPRLVTLSPLGSGPPPAVNPGRRVGNPAGDPQFTIWQPGVLESGLAQGRDGQPLLSAGLYTFSPLDIIAITTDGSVAYSPLGFTGRLQSTGVAAPTSTTLARIVPLPLLPRRDVALQAVLNSIATPDVGTPTPQAVEIAWRPNGTVLAALPLDGKNHTIRLFDTASGSVLGTLTLPTRFAQNDRAAPQLRWSPDGTHLLGVVPELSTIAVWDVSKILG
jgi:WD40 repeat protein